MNASRSRELLITSLRYSLLVIMVAMPFHAFFTTWVGSNFGGLLWWRAWKEVLLAVLLVVGLWLFFTDSKLRRTIWSRFVNKLIALYALWHVIISVFSTKEYDALAQGLAINLRFLLIFVLFQVVVFYKPISRNLLFKIILIPSVFVVVFGLMQIFILPKNFLEWFG